MRSTPEYGYDTISEHFDNSLSVLANARKLYAIDDKKSVKGWEMSIYRWKNNEKPAPKPEKEPVIENELEAVKQSYHYDSTKDEYYTFLRVADQMICVDGDKHRAMKEAYSNMVGKPASMNEICREFGIPRAWFDEYRRVHGWTHDMLPYTDEEVVAQDNDELVADLVLRNRREIHKKYERKKWKEIEDAAEKWFNLEDTIGGMIKLEKPATKVPKLKLKEAKDPFCVVMSPTDFHWGKHGWIDEVGETYNFSEARSRLMDRTEEIISWLPARPDKIIIATGSDWFHVDNDLGQTTRGTPQDMCGSPAEILITGCKLAREHIDLLRQVGPVEVVFMTGNHDRHSALALMLYLEAAYENVPDVTVNLDPSTRHYTTYGNTLLGFSHGDTVRKEKLPTLMSKEQRVLWGQTESHIWFTGHLHHQVLYEMDGGLVIQLPSLAGHDRYHARQGYTTAKAGLAAHIIDKELGLIGSMFSPVRHR